MNALFNGMTNGPSIMFQALGAMMRGESPQQFMQGLAQQHPQLRGIDFSNMQAAAQSICQQNGVDMNTLTNQLEQSAAGIMK